MKNKQSKIVLAQDFFNMEKTNDVFREVTFKYDKDEWIGAIPKVVEYHGLELSDDKFKDSIEICYEYLKPENKKSWIKKSDEEWEKKEDNKTYEVLNALYSGKWECRVCGPTQVNSQAAARIKALKQRGYTIASKRKECVSCSKVTMHDILVMIPKPIERLVCNFNLRKPISNMLISRIQTLLKRKEACFNVIRTSEQLVVDHKFPSQRWNKAESDNPDTMSESDIKSKFQLLSNQTNMWKSRKCDECVKSGTRGYFMGIHWFYAGTDKWQGKDKYDEKGCVGCPWYDFEKWREELYKTLNS